MLLMKLNNSRREFQVAVALDVFQEFQTDHRQIRDVVIDLSRAIGERDLLTARGLLGQLNALAGPHFRFEEESLYPALRPFFSGYVDKLYSDHDGAIQTARWLVDRVSQEHISPEQALEGRQQALNLLIHVSDCQGLAIIMERMPRSDLDYIAERMLAARADGKTLLDWAGSIRQRSA